MPAKIPKHGISHLTGPVEVGDARDLEIRVSVSEQKIRGKTTLVLCARFKDTNGKNKKSIKVLNLSPTKKNRVLAGRMVDDFTDEITSRYFITDKDPVPFSGFARETFERIMRPPYVRLSTQLLYERNIRLHIAPYFQDLDVRKITKHHLDHFVSILLDEGFSNSMINSVVGTLNSIMTRAVDMEIIHFAPKRSRVTPSKARDAYLTRQQVGVFFQYVERHRPTFHALYLTLLQTGMRIGELLCLRRDSVDWDNRTIRITGTYNSCKNLVFPTKTGKPRTVPIGDQLLEKLQQFVDGRVPKPCSSTKNYFISIVPGDEFLFDKQRPEGVEKLKHVNMRKVTNRIFRKTGIPHSGDHVFRHTCASLLAQSGTCTLHDIQVLLGHASIRTTERYAHLLPATTSLVNKIKWV